MSPTPLQLELGQVRDDYARRALEQISLRWRDAGALTPSPSVGTSLPTNPTDGQQFIYRFASVPGYGQPMYWKFQYSAADAKWFFVGGPPWASPSYANRTSFNTASTATYTNLDASPPSCDFVSPFNAGYELRANLEVALGTGGFFRAVFALNGNPGSTMAEARAATGAAANSVALSLMGATGVSAGTVINLYGSTNNTAANFAWLISRYEVTPVYVN